MLVTTVASAGQDYPTAELYGGYSYLNIGTNNLSSRANANGWEGSLSGNFNKWFAGEFGATGNYWNSGHDYAFGAGPGVNIRPVFLHALVGVDYLSVNSHSLQTTLYSAFGGGVQWKVAPQVSVRTSADYLPSNRYVLNGTLPSVAKNNFRVSVGLVYSIGGTAAENRASGLSKPSRPQTPNTNPQSVPLGTLGVVVSLGRSEGAEITEVAPGGAAAAASLQPGDVINSVDGKHVKNPTELVSELSSRTARDRIQLGYLHRFWELKTQVVVGSARTTPPAEITRGSPQTTPPPAPTPPPVPKHKGSRQLAGYTAILVEPFAVENDQHTKNFSDEEGANLQVSTVAALRESELFETVIDGTQKPLDGAREGQRKVILSATVIGFKQGSSGARYMTWPFPVGVSKARALFVLRDAASNQEIFRFEKEARFQAAGTLGIATKERQMSHIKRGLVDALIKEIKRNR